MEVLRQMIPAQLSSTAALTTWSLLIKGWEVTKGRTVYLQGNSTSKYLVQVPGIHAQTTQSTTASTAFCSLGAFHFLRPRKVIGSLFALLARSNVA